MFTYSYIAVSDDGRQVRGEVSATNINNAKQSLRKNGLLIKKISEKRTSSIIKKRMNKDDFVQFVSEFVSLIKAGLTVPEAVEQCADRPANKLLSKTLYSVLDMLKQGKHLSEALSEYPDIFENMLISAVKTGEIAGDLEGPVGKYHSYIEHKNNLEKNIRQSLVYPVFVIAAMIIILALLFVFVMPRFIGLYSSFEAELPAPTAAVIFMVKNAKIIVPLLILAGITVYFSLKAVLSGDNVRKKADEIKFSVPFFGKISKELETAGLARSIHTLLSGGTPLAEALEIAASNLKNRYYKDKMHKVISGIKSGIRFSEISKSEELFPRTAVKLIEVGESSGTLGDALGEIAEYYGKSAEISIKSLMTILEPMLMFLTGIVVGGMIVIMYLPIFRLTEIIR